MFSRYAITLAIGCLVTLRSAQVAYADNPMGYRLLSQQEASNLPRNQGALGLDVERASQITDDGLTFDIIRIKQVHRGSSGAQAGFNIGDQIIAIDGRVFPSLATFAAYVGSTLPGRRINVDYIPTGGGPQQAQRITVLIGCRWSIRTRSVNGITKPDTGSGRNVHRNESCNRRRGCRLAGLL